MPGALLNGANFDCNPSIDYSHLPTELEYFASNRIRFQYQRNECEIGSHDFRCREAPAEPQLD